MKDIFDDGNYRAVVEHEGDHVLSIVIDTPNGMIMSVLSTNNGYRISIYGNEDDGIKLASSLKSYMNSPSFLNYEEIKKIIDEHGVKGLYNKILSYVISNIEYYMDDENQDD